MSKPTVEYRWEASDETGRVVKRGTVRTDLPKVIKSKLEIESEIRDLESADGVAIQGRRLAPYWRGLRLRVITRTITPWEPMLAKASETQV